METGLCVCVCVSPSVLARSTVSGEGVGCDCELKESRLSKESSRLCLGGDNESECSDSQLSTHPLSRTLRLGDSGSSFTHSYRHTHTHTLIETPVESVYLFIPESSLYVCHMLTNREYNESYLCDCYCDGAPHVYFITFLIIDRRPSNSFRSSVGPLYDAQPFAVLPSQ